MEEWKEYKLGEIAEFRTGKLNSNASVDKGKYPFFTCSPETYFINDYAFDQKAILLAGNNAEGNFNVKYYEGKFNAYQRTYVINPIHDNVGIHFLYYALQLCLQSLKLLSQGTSTKFLTAKILNAFSIQVPPRIVQDKIVSIIKSLDDKIEVNRRINENLEQQAQALFKSWFVDFEPFRDGEFVESELGMIPKGWKLKRIYEYVDVIYGAPYKSSLFNDEKEGLPLIRIRDLKTNSPQFYTPEILPNTEYIEAGDIVAGMDAEFTPYVWQGERGVLNQRCCKFKGKYEGISNYFILFLIKPELEYVQSYKTGTTVSHLGKSDIDRFVFLTPPLDIVLAFSEIVNPMIKEVVNRAKESRRLATLRDTLLPKLMSGELKVNDVD